ncbi:MAG: transglycosylase SLT domain-containing protein [Pseudomonadota bacterium]
MLNRFSRRLIVTRRQVVSQSSVWATIAADTVNGFRTTAHHTLLISGIAAIAALAVLFVKPELTDHVKALSPFSEAVAQESVPVAPAVADNVITPSTAPLTQVSMHEPKASAPAFAPALHKHLNIETDSKAAVSDPQQMRVTTWLAKRYRVAGDATNMLVSAAYASANEIKLDPLLILAVMAIESGLNPFAESPVGAQGLMQVMSKIHHEKFKKLGGVKAALNPVANIKVGSLILKDYVKRGGSVEAGLKMYVGAAAFETDSGYGSKVLAEYRRLKEVATGKTVPTTSLARATRKAPPRMIETKTEPLLEAVASPTTGPDGLAS